jgi:hypothetical protein
MALTTLALTVHREGQGAVTVASVVIAPEEGGQIQGGKG